MLTVFPRQLHINFMHITVTRDIFFFMKKLTGLEKTLVSLKQVCPSKDTFTHTYHYL